MVASVPGLSLARLTVVFVGRADGTLKRTLWGVAFGSDAFATERLLLRSGFLAAIKHHERVVASVPGFSAFEGKRLPANSFSVF